MKKNILYVVIVTAILGLAYLGYQKMQETKINNEVDSQIVDDMVSEKDLDEMEKEMVEKMDHESKDGVDIHTNEISIDYEGSYQGHTSCGEIKECYSILTTLKLNKDKTYKLSEQIKESPDSADNYKNKKSLTEQSGKYEVKDNSVIIILKDGSKKVYEMGENRLRHDEDILIKFLNQ